MRYDKNLLIFRGAIARSLIVLLACGVSHRVEAIDLTFTAEFRPNASNPTNNRFVNTTRNSGYCEQWPDRCGDQAFGVSLPLGLIFENMDVNGWDRNSAYFKYPTSYKDVPVTSDMDGSHANVQWRVNAMSMRINNWNQVAPAAGWQSWGTYPPRPCVRVATGLGAGAWYEFVWGLPENAGPCVQKPRGQVSTPMVTSRLSIGYELVTPDPLAMKNGIYRGDLILTVGPGGDFDFGDRSTISDSVVNLHFELTVRHEFRVDFPPGSDRAVLAPEGGWSSWIDHGRLPTRLSKDLPFSLSSSVPFSVTLQCQYSQPGGDCGLRNITEPTAPEVPVEIALTMPGFREIGSNVDALNLKFSREGTPVRFTSDAYAIDRASRLHFDVKGEHVKSILDHEGSQYRGNVTLVFDAHP